MNQVEQLNFIRSDADRNSFLASREFSLSNGEILHLLSFYCSEMQMVSALKSIKPVGEIAVDTIVAMVVSDVQKVAIVKILAKYCTIGAVKNIISNIQSDLQKVEAAKVLSKMLSEDMNNLLLIEHFSSDISKVSFIATFVLSVVSFDILEIVLDSIFSDAQKVRALEALVPHTEITPNQALKLASGIFSETQRRRAIEILSRKIAGALDQIPKPAPVDPRPIQASSKINAVPIETEECAVCMEVQKTHAFVPCGHRCVCVGCSEAIMKSSKKCPLCNQVSACAIKVYN